MTTPPFPDDETVNRLLSDFERGEYGAAMLFHTQHRTMFAALS